MPPTPTPNTGTASTSATATMEFHWVQSDEPHASRRKAILAAHPEVSKLFVREIRTAPLVLALVSAQLAICYFIISQLSVTSFWFWFLAYFVGGTINHSLQLAVHELSHNLCFETPIFNQIAALVCNFPTGVPSAVLFTKYHMEHHMYQGVDKLDTDVPTQAEVKLVGNNMFMKLLWVLCQPAFYAIRPMIVKPKVPTKWEFINFGTQFAFNALVVYYLGWTSMLYLFAGSILGTGLHPAAGHFIAEHYEFVKNSETYSYYGPLNYVNFNVGYHNEHHDFPRIPWSKLPQVRKIAPEFYKDLPYHTSYLAVFWRYITDPTIGPFSRVKRKSTRWAEM